MVRRERRCAHCGMRFLARHTAPKQRFCSARCWYSSRHAGLPSAETNCGFCGKRFRLWPSRIKSRNYCSVECRLRAQVRKIERPCLYCGVIIEVIPSNSTHRYCSKRCELRWRYEKGLVSCAKCGRGFHPPKGAARGQRYCSRSCAQSVNARKRAACNPAFGLRGLPTEHRLELARRGGVACAAYGKFRPRLCEVCAHQFIPRSGRSRLCSDVCRAIRHNEANNRHRAKVPRRDYVRRDQVVLRLGRLISELESIAVSLRP